MGGPISWIVLAEPITASAQQMARFRSIFPEGKLAGGTADRRQDREDGCGGLRQSLPAEIAALIGAAGYSAACASSASRSLCWRAHMSA